MAGKKDSAPSLLDQYKAGQVAEWGVFVCGSRPIDIEGVRAFNPGDAVPASHVTRGIVDEGDVITRDDSAGLESLDQTAVMPDPSLALPGADTVPNPEDTQDATGGK